MQIDVEQIGGQFWLIRYDDNGTAYIADGPFSTEKQAEVMAKLKDN